MGMRAIAIGEDSEANLAIPIAEQEGRIACNATAVRDIAIALAHLCPPRQSEPGGFVSPNSFYPSLELVVLAREHLLQGLLADDPLFFKGSAVEICDQPVGLIEHSAIDNARRPDRGPNSHGWYLAPGLCVHCV